jgi:ADP-heptose:LPS heptosyltransferase
MPSRNHAGDIESILIIKMWALGDILMATPMLNAIRAAKPDARISWMVDVQHAELLANHPLIDELIVIDAGQWRRLLRKANIPAWIARTSELNADMRSRRFDTVINCFPEKWWTYYLCAAPVRVGLFPSPTLPRTRHLYTHALPRPTRAGLHNTDHYLLATEAAGYPPASKKMSVGETAHEAVFLEEFARRHAMIVGRMTVVIAPFSTALNRTFDMALTVGIADWLVSECEAQVIVTGAPGDADRARAIAGRASVSVIVAESTTVREYIALIRRADLVITGDSSAMHIAAAVGTPYVALFGPTPSDERAPLEGRGVVLSKPLSCAPCDLPTCANKVFQQCMRLIELADVQRAVNAVGAGTRKQ